MTNTSSFAAATDGARVAGTLTDNQVVTPQVPAGLRSDGPRVTFNFRGAWNSGNTYYYYDVVRDTSGRSWICKYPQVPAGTALEESTYWTNWADPNIEFEELSQLVATYDGRITKNESGISTLNDKFESYDAKLKTVVDDILIIGDSWSEPYEVRSYETWTRYLSDYTKATVHNYARGGAQVVGSEPDPGLNGNFLGQVESALNDTSYDHNNIGTIIIEGGINDYRSGRSYSLVLSAFTQHINRLHDNFKNARIICVLNHQVLVTKDQWEFFNIIRFSLSAICECHMTFGWFQYPELYSTEDYVHPSTKGYYCMRQNMLAILYGGSINYAVNYWDFIIEDSEGNKFNIMAAPYCNNENGTIETQLAIQVLNNVNVSDTKVFQCRIDRDGNVLSEGWTISKASFFNIFALTPCYQTTRMEPLSAQTRNKSCYLSIDSPETNSVKQGISMNFAFTFKNISEGESVTYAFYGKGITAQPYNNYY